jgi:hypothetical protein
MLRMDQTECQGNENQLEFRLGEPNKATNVLIHSTETGSLAILTLIIFLSTVLFSCHYICWKPLSDPNKAEYSLSQ